MDRDKSDSHRQNRNSFHQQNQSHSTFNGENKLDQLDQKQIRLPEIRREPSQGSGLPQVYPKTSSASASKTRNSQNPNTQYYDNNLQKGAALYASYNTAAVANQYGGYKSRQSLDHLPFQLPNQAQQANFASVQFSQDMLNQQPVAIGLSYVLNKIKKDRKVTDDEALIMENRIKLLKKEEHKTKKKIEEMNKKSDDIFTVKARHEKSKQIRQQIQQQEEIRQQMVQEQHENMRLRQKEKRFEKISEILLKNHQHYEHVKTEKEAFKVIIQEQKKKEEEENIQYVKKLRKKQNIASKKIQEQKYSGVEKIIERYQQEIQVEEQRKLENQMRIQKMEHVEQNLIKKLQKSQIVQHQALLQLQDAIKLKPSEYVAKITSKSMEMGQAKPRLIIKRGQNTEADPYAYNIQQNAATTQNQEDQHSKSFSANYNKDSTPSKQRKLNQTYCAESNVKEQYEVENIDKQNQQSQQFDLSKELAQSTLNKQTQEQDNSINPSKQFTSQNSEYKSKLAVSQFEGGDSKNIQESSIKEDAELNGIRSSTMSNKREIVSRSANDIILQNTINPNDAQHSHSNEEDKLPPNISNSKAHTQEVKNRSRSTFKTETRQNDSPKRDRVLSQSNYQHFDTENYIQRYDTDYQAKDQNKKRKKSKKKKSRKSQSISVSQQHLNNFSTNYNQQQIAYPVVNLNPAFNIINPITHKKNSSTTPIKTNIILTKPPMVF